MMKDYSKYVKKAIKKFGNSDFEFGKSERYLKHRTGASFENMKKELLRCKSLKFTEKRNMDGEERYTLYFIYTKTRGRAYAITFRHKVRVITAFPLGRRTLVKYNKQKFKKSK